MIDIVIYWAIFIALILIPVWVSVKIYQYFQKKNSDLRFAAFIPVAIVIVIAYFLKSPSDKYYKEIYQEVTRSEFPINARIKAKYTTEQSWLNGRTLLKISMDPEHVSNLRQQLIGSGYAVDKDPKEYQQLKFNDPGNFQLSEQEKIGDVLYNRPVGQSDLYYSVAFLTDGETIVVKKVNDLTEENVK